jgi:hypothetical protein
MLKIRKWYKSLHWTQKVALGLLIFSFSFGGTTKYMQFQNDYELNMSVDSIEWIVEDLVDVQMEQRVLMETPIEVRSEPSYSVARAPASSGFMGAVGIIEPEVMEVAPSPAPPTHEVVTEVIELQEEIDELKEDLAWMKSMMSKEGGWADKLSTAFMAAMSTAVMGILMTFLMPVIRRFQPVPVAV